MIEAEFKALVLQKKALKDQEDYPEKSQREEGKALGEKWVQLQDTTPGRLDRLAAWLKSELRHTRSYKTTQDQWNAVFKAVYQEGSICGNWGRFFPGTYVDIESISLFEGFVEGAVKLWETLRPHVVNENYKAPVVTDPKDAMSGYLACKK
jgi:hypothetical protein